MARTKAVKPLNEGYVVQGGKIRKAIITEVQEITTLAPQSADYCKTEQRVYYAVKSGEYEDGTPKFSYHILGKGDIFMSSYLKILRHLKENVVDLQKKDIDALLEKEELPF